MDSPDTAPPRRPALGLTERLVLGYVLAALFTMSSAAVFLYHMLYTSFEIEDAELLTDHVNTLRHELERAPESLREAEEIILSTATHRTLERYYGQLLDHTGKVLLETPASAIWWRKTPPSRSRHPRMGTSQRWLAMFPTKASRPSWPPRWWPMILPNLHSFTMWHWT
ncbi:hypothetical protein [Verrucomicrobium spinosum]|uniref:hypothetical protein n=1 Tax=Verrucomicrobium spinosum TaxID=2736 RepID=UPI00155DC63F|nr:hypothetical protein [Verrucomicrobium spinosum]